jgi:diaminohydroxyphosphoribosylaminopyrimidine deaminase/5-amino-6-(5-phosphoribosylamino)uracil reductase
VITVKKQQGRVDLRDLMRKLGKRDIASVLIEGGSEINASALKAGIVDKVVMFLSPLIMTGTDSICSIGGICPPKLSQVRKLRDLSVRFVGKDLMVEGYVR